MAAPFRLHRPENWRAWREAAPFGAVGGSDVARILGVHTFKGTPAQAHADQGHRLEPLILARLHAFLVAMGQTDLPAFEQGWVAESLEDPRDRGSLDGLAHVASVPVAVGEAKAVFLGQRQHWRAGTTHARMNGLARYVECQALHYINLLDVPCYVAALVLPGYDLGGMPPEAAILLGELRVWVLTPERTRGAREAIRDCIAAWREAGCPESMPALGAFAERMRPQVLPGSFDDALLLARFMDARAQLEQHQDAATRAREDLGACRDEIRARVGDQRGIVAGGRIATVDRRGTVRVRHVEVAGVEE